MSKAIAEGITFTKEPYIEDAGPRKIKNMKFGTLSESEIAKIAEVQVWKGSYYDHFKAPIPGGLLEPRMGPANKDLRCATCGGDFNGCPGHYGYLKLALPVFNVGYLGKVVEILKSVCKQCARILLNEDTCKEHLKKMRNPKFDAQGKIELAKKITAACAKASGVVMCPRCGYLNGSVKKVAANVKIIHDRSKCNDSSVDKFQSALSHTRETRVTSNVDSHNLDAFLALSLFRRMLDEDCELLYLAERPENLITTTLAVPPLAIRPSVMMSGSLQSNENDITERLKLIVHSNAAVRQALEEPNGFRSSDVLEVLQYEVAQFINSEVRGVPYNIKSEKEKNLSGFVQRLKGKQGRFRGNLCGKRVEFTGRTVISPDPNLKITEVGIPIHMALKLTYPERVSHHNIEKLRQCVRNGPDKYPGGRTIRRGSGSWNLNHASRKRKADELRFGDIVDRHLEDGDIVLFNRQPSLHRMSIMCHRARIMPWRTLRFNESVCNPYNADFDGDEMNLHVPQTEEARTEAILLMGVQNNLCTPKNGEILVASTQDFLTTSFLITRKDTFYDRSTFSLICSYMGDGMDLVDLPVPAIIKPVELWSGKQVFSILLRPHANVRVYVNLTVKERIYTKPDKNKREVKTMCPKDGFVYFRNSELISGQLGKVTLGNGNKNGLFSVLLRDYKAQAAASCMNRLAKLSARWIGNHGFSIGIDDVQPKVDLINEKDETLSTGYKKCDDFIKAFNKGKLELEVGCDASQTLETKIQVVLNGLRNDAAMVCIKNLLWRNSPLIMYQCGSKGSDINISQMIACVGQQSVGGCRAPNGFVDRSLPHFPKQAKNPAAKGFVANSFYSGLSATEFFFHTMGGREGLVDTAVKTADTGYMSRRLMKCLEDLFLHYDSTVRSAGGGVVQFCYGDDGMDPAGMEGKDGKPLDFERLFLRSKAICPPSDGDGGILSSDERKKKVEEELNSLFKIDESRTKAEKVVKEKLKEDFIRKLLEKPGDDEHENLKGFIERVSGMTSRQLMVFLDICLSRYDSKKIEPGTPIGAIGAHSIGEPGTQMTLKTFHFAGVASMNVTDGVPRIKEIINGAGKISTPIITAILETDDNASIVKYRIEKTTLGQVAKSIKVVMTSRSASIVITLDMKIIQDAHLNIDANTVKESILETMKKPRLPKLKEQHIKVLDIKKLEVVPPDADRSKIQFQLHVLENLLPSVVVKGIKTAERVVVHKDKDNKLKLLVEGTGLGEVMGTQGIDGSKTQSNHIDEVQRYLGIEAARIKIIKEIDDTMKKHGMNIDVRHMMLLADVMTVRGKVLGITRHGIQKMGKSVLMLASFEKTSDHLFNASIHGQEDLIEGVSECIIMGMPIQIGTGMIKVKQKLDPPVLPQGTDPILSRF